MKISKNCVALICVLGLERANGFIFPASHGGYVSRSETTAAAKLKTATTSPLLILPRTTSTIATGTALQLARDENKYSTEVRLRVEAESPFRKVRLFLYTLLLGGCVISLLVSAARIAAGLNGINVDLLDESLTNAAIDLGGIAVLGYLTKNDLDAQESKLKRASKGGTLANLPVRGKAEFFLDKDKETYLTRRLADFRAGRGIDKRIAVCAAGEETISTILNELAGNESLQESLIRNDLLVIPVVLPGGTAPIGTNMDSSLLESECVALPMSNNAWKSFIQDEVDEAAKQDIDVMKTGVALIIKKNGRVGQRTSGINLPRMTGEVEEREASGMDVTNI